MIEIGPGAAVAFLAGGLSRPEPKRFGLAELRFQSFRFTESVLRHVPRMPLRSLEPAEIVALVTASTSPEVLSELVVVDRDSRVLRAAQRALRRAPQLPANFVQFDINSGQAWPQSNAQIVCAYKCSHLLDSPTKLFDCAASMLSDGGLFSTTDRVQHQNFVAIDEQAGLYRKVKIKAGTIAE
jgi:hypothetical protein